jgi:hypothetical protein
MLKAFKSIARVSEGNLTGLYAAPETVISQTESVGLIFLEMLGSHASAKPLFNRYRSHDIYYAFQKP